MKPDEVETTPESVQFKREDMAALTADAVDIEMNNGVAIKSSGRPTDLLHGGEDFGDTSDKNMRKWRRNEILLREIMCQEVLVKGLKRPTPNKWCKKTPAKSK